MSWYCCFGMDGTRLALQSLVFPLGWLCWKLFRGTASKEFIEFANEVQNAASWFEAKVFYSWLPFLRSNKLTLVSVCFSPRMLGSVSSWSDLLSSKGFLYCSPALYGWSVSAFASTIYFGRLPSLPFGIILSFSTSTTNYSLSNF